MTHGNDPDTATGVLRDEHQLILGVVEVLDSTFADGAGGNGLDFEVVDDCVAFFRLFADACHHGKEEDLLFRELIDQGMPSDGGPIGVMLSEHQQGRLYVRGMAEAISAARGGDGEAEATLRGNARRYVDLMRSHIGKEDGILFDMADNMVVGAACQTLCAGYETACQGRFEGKTKADLEAIAARLMAGRAD
jgi:hemerythrin-like domain-containing protein